MRYIAATGTIVALPPAACEAPMGSGEIQLAYHGRVCQ